MYLKALLRGLFEGPSADPDLRAELEAEADRQGAAALHARLAIARPADRRAGCTRTTADGSSAPWRSSPRPGGR